MKKLLLALLVALCAAFALIGFAACDSGTTPDHGGETSDVEPSDNVPDANGSDDETPDDKDPDDTEPDDRDPDDKDPDDTPVEVPCTVSVTCGSGGTYELSPAGPYHVGDEVTLTLTPYSGYAAGEVKVNGTATAVTGNACTFSLAGNTTVEVSFDPIPQHTVTVNCGAGGSCDLSPNRSKYYEGTEVTLTVTVLEHFLLTGVLFNGKAVELDEDNGYTFTVEGETVIDVTFEDTRYKTVKVNCGAGGTYTLSPDGPYLTGTEVTLAVTPEDGYRVGKVLVNGTEVTLAESKCTFPLDVHTTVEISFVEMGSVFPADLMGRWNPFIGSGIVGESLVLGRDSVTFAGKECIVTEGDTLTFTYTDDDGDSTAYTVSYRLLREGKYLFMLSYRDKSDNSTVTVCYLKDGVDYFTYAFPAEFVGEWELPDTTGGAITVTEDSFTMGTSSAIVMSYDETAGRLTMMGEGGEEFTLSRSGSQLACTTIVDGKENVVYYSKVIGMDPVLIPQYAGTYTSKDGKNILVVNEDGTAKYSTNAGTSYYENVVFRPADKFGTMPNCFTMNYGEVMNVDFLTDAGLGMRVWVRRTYEEGVSLYASDYKEPFLTVEIDCGEHGSYTVTPLQEEYRAGDVVTITITADEGYVFDTVEQIDMYGRWAKVYPSDNKTYTVTITITEKMIALYGDAGYKRAYRVTFKEDPSQA